jgi:hypothetical protein
MLKQLLSKCSGWKKQQLFMPELQLVQLSAAASVLQLFLLN